MLVSHRHKFIYLKARKVAGTSIESYLERYCMSEELEKVHQPKHASDFKKDSYGIIGARMNGNSNPKWYNHKLSSELKKDLGDDIWNNYTKICNIRNPYDMIVSWYHYQTRQNVIDKKKFNLFLNHKINQNIIKKNKEIWSYNGNFDFEYIRFENLEEDLYTIMEKLNLKNYEDNVPHFKKSNRTHWRKYYNDKSIEIVYNMFKEEINHFGYQFI